MYRIFGSPYNLSFHQSAAYLRHKKVAFKAYTGSLTSTKLMSMWYRARLSFCTLSPQKDSMLLIHQVLEKCEADSARKEFARKKAGEEVDAAKLAMTDLLPQMRLINPELYPRLNLASWAMFLYASSWLGSTGSLYRWVHGNGSSVVDDYVGYLSRATSIVPGAATLVSPRIRNLMISTMAEIGIVKEAEPYMIGHFTRLLEALEAHFTRMGGPAAATEEAVASSSLSVNTRASPYVLGTEHPTLADIALAAVFDGYFLRDDPPALDVINKYPSLNRYLALVSELGESNAKEARLSALMRGGMSEREAKESIAGFPIVVSGTIPGYEGCDEVPPSLQPVLDLMTEIFPWQIAQCDALRLYAKKGMPNEKTTVLDVGSELPLVLWGRSSVVEENGAEEAAVNASTSDNNSKALLPAGVLSGKLTAKLLPPKLKASPYIMLVDRSILPAHTRCQEVELAQVCAMGAMGAYPLFTTTDGLSSEGSEGSNLSIHGCGGCSDAFLASLQKSSPSEALYALAANLLQQSDSALKDRPLVAEHEEAKDVALPHVDSIDFDTHHVHSPAATKGGKGTSELQRVKQKAKTFGSHERRIAYDVKRAKGEAAAPASTSAPAASDASASSATRYESDILLSPSESLDFALARVAMLMGRMYISEFEVRSVYRNRGIEFAVIPRRT